MPSPPLSIYSTPFRLMTILEVPLQHVHNSFAQGSAFIAKHDTTVAEQDEHVASYLRLYS
jgi:hypothetical protein